MKCPLDGSNLVMTERAGVEIDYCPTCRGVWLDRGELDKIIERSAAPVQPVAPPSQEYREEYRDEYRKPKKKRGSFLEDLFDF
ncbi:zf-TFIIB domain-containing protein [Mesobacterium pallidum]|uniref:TFIIB-type zinc ribbon-containing protein n=1 Tax=Mesobacterium pallidum TaxID=2872037 RepID=UPI001EE2003B|nr:zf-TFIIB domain-containing protein [Mesobacterium pallidum]